MASRIASALRAVALVGAIAIGGGVPVALLAPAGSPLGPAAAQADGDPASDVLLGENVFYPYSPPVPRAIQQTLNAETAAAKTAGFPIKVALIAAPTDLGVIPGLFGKPQSYADFLDQEISFAAKQRVLVVMSTGYGLAGFAGPAQLAAHSLARPAGPTSTALARAAIVAVARLAAASGHRLPGVPGISGTGSGTAGGGTGHTPIVIGLVVAAVLVAAALVVLRRRQAGQPAA